MLSHLLGMALMRRGPLPARAAADSKKREAAEKEYKILTAIDHPYVCKCYEAFETDDKIYLMLELMEGGELFDRIVDMGHFTEEMAADVTYKLLGALKYMHDKKIAHRDLKPENMLMTGKGGRGRHHVRATRPVAAAVVVALQRPR